ncbi:autoinducer binding domain-containing protein [Burkholderia sp. BE12]|uniref:autoinducer binding domain-containing protein n=1 Tax=Burkholderia sp. BE12 TaxID=2082394 RepID=UPI000CF43B4D|nr:autoinducer binding domain-containing protein [Burkholderia sp. BE12]
MDQIFPCSVGNTPVAALQPSHAIARWAPLATSFLDTVDLSSLVKLFGDVAASLGFPRFAVSRLSRARARSRVAMAVDTLYARYPDNWVFHYAKHDYGPVDPVHRMALVHATPYRWTDIVGLNHIEQRVLDEAREAGLANGVSIPIHEPDGNILLVNLASPSPEIKTEVNLRLASLISALFHQELNRLTRPRCVGPLPKLSPRQKECLAWVARGKSSWEIAGILGISPHTVDYHIDEAKRSLRINSRTAAAVYAAAHGLILV